MIAAILKRHGNGKLSQYLACISACIVAFTSGIHYGWTGPSLRKILTPEYPHEVTPDEASYIAIVSCAGHVIGGFSGSALSDTIGRKYTLLAIAVPQVSSLLLIYFSYVEKYFLYAARVVGGVAEGGIVAVLPIYIAEVSSPDIRGAIGTLSTLASMYGCLFINLLGSYTNIHTTALICLAFPVLHWICFVNFPESPYFLLMKGKVERTRESLKVLRGSQDIEKELLGLTGDVARQMSESGTYLDLFTIDSNRKAFLLVTAARIFQQFTGISAFVSYYQILIEQSTNLSPVLGSSLILLTQIAMNHLTSSFVDRFGRKPLLTLSAGLTCFVLLVLGVYFTLKDYTSLDLSGVLWFPLPVMVLFIISSFLGIGVIIPIVVSEIYSTSIKSKAVSLGSIVFASSMMASTKFYQYSADNFGLAVPFYSFGACTFFGMLFYRFGLPETKGKTLEAIQQELKGNRIKN
ncbi:facilitated trehalose transporter Tret1-like [Anoplophora glabripennis]|uniref:facilitated trehalose transporter Tret1-like n=1 Tax=Anoplophora glabripennis TaxID=217634 RepID=UPI000873F44F|nr:facilitated trehalose transporter Tret1-like [Anoplophora glabripennis]